MKNRSPNKAEKEKSSSPSRSVKVLLIAVAAGAGTALIRSVTGFFPVLQGISAGAASALASGLFLRKSAPSPNERAWLWLNACLTFALVLVVCMDMLNARPFSPPFYWLRSVIQSAESEHFFGAPIYSWGLRGGEISGAGWIIFNWIDGVFFFFSGLITLGISADRRKRPQKGSPPAPAKKFFLIQWAAVTALLIAFTIAARLPAAPDRMRSLEGRYVFQDGMNVLLPSGLGGVFTAEASGHGSLALKSEPENAYHILVRRDGRYFTGLLYRGNALEKIFIKFSGDGRILISARRKPAGGLKKDLIVEAVREEARPADNTNQPED